MPDYSQTCNDIEEKSDLSMTLQWSSRFLVDIHDHTVWVTWQVYTDVDVNLRHLLVDLSLRSSLGWCCSQ